MSRAKQRESTKPVTINASYISLAHTVLAYSAFGSALLVGCALHYHKIVKNGVAGYPQEWFPSVSATIGDWYPERSIFQIFIAMTAGPRFVLVYLWFLLTRSKFLLFIGVIRTLSCGGWVYITSSDDHDAHDVLMILYIVCNLPWMIGGVLSTPSGNIISKRRRKLIMYSFFFAIIPMIYFFVQHKVHRIPGAYTYYSFFEWFLILADIAYDGVTQRDFAGWKIELTNVNIRTDVHTMSINSTSAPRFLGLSPVVDKKTATELVPETPTATLLSFFADTYLSFVFWSNLTALTVVLFYFSVWELGIAGYEASLLTILSPVLLANKSLRSFAQSRTGRTSLHTLSLGGLAAYLTASPRLRLALVAGANIAMFVGKAVDWSGDVALSGHHYTFLTGLVLSCTAKLLNHSNNPIWPILDHRSGGWNKTGLALGTLSIMQFHLRSNVTFPPPRTSVSSKSWFQTAVSFGALLFACHRFLADSGTLVAWSWSGYPIKGPIPGSHGALTILAMVFGSVIAFTIGTGTRLSHHPAWAAFGCAAAYTLYTYKDWTGYGGSLGFVMYLTSIAPGIILAAAQTGAGWIVYFVASLVTCLFYLADVWTVAYAFVPLGSYLRERTDLVLIALMVTLNARNIGYRGIHKPCTAIYGRYAGLFVGLLSLSAFTSTLSRVKLPPPAPHHPADRLLTAGIWTVHFGVDLEGRDSQRRMTDLVKEMELDVLGLLETDLQRPVFGNRDLTRVMAEELNYHVDFGPGPNQHTWGAVLLSKFPILASTHHLLPSPDGELAPAISATIDVWGTNVSVIVAHNGQEETPVDRELQSKELARIMASTYPEPVVFLGYVVTEPHAPRPAPYDILITDGRVFDIDKDDLDRWCEYILYRGMYRTGYARVSRSSITDTELQVGKFVLPRPGTTLEVDKEDEERFYQRAWKREMESGLWFPEQFMGEGVRGHRYHVFDTPLYYKFLLE